MRILSSLQFILFLWCMLFTNQMTRTDRTIKSGTIKTGNYFEKQASVTSCKLHFFNIKLKFAIVQ